MDSPTGSRLVRFAAFWRDFVKLCSQTLLIVGLCLSLAYCSTARAEETDYGTSCLALIAFTEQNKMQPEGMKLVVLVALNRMRDRRWPGTPCEVMEQEAQFSGIGPWGYPRLPWLINRARWQMALHAVWHVTGGTYEVPGQCVSERPLLWFHAVYVKPAWAASYTPVCIVDDHIFYSERA